MLDGRGSVDHLTFDKEATTPLHCHECGKDFVAILDYTQNGNHIVECAHCGHEHCRVIVDGKVTGDRWSSTYGSDKTRDGIRSRRVWADQRAPEKVVGKTSMLGQMLRDRWLEKSRG